MKSATIALAMFLGAATLAGCATRAQTGALYGGTAGAIIGGVATHSLGGALVGTAVGAAAGYVVGANSYKCVKRDWFTGRRYWGWCLR